MSTAQTLAFKGGGTLLRESFYLTRLADDELCAALLRGEYCKVFAPRQIGKSSSCIRAQWLLEAETKRRCVDFALTGFGTKVSSDQWYQAVAGTIADKLGHNDSFDAFWRETAEAKRWSRFLLEFLPARLDGDTVIFIDELDTIFRIESFSTDDFFAGIRDAYNARVTDERLRRLTFCLIGVVLEGDLAIDRKGTPFNIGEKITLTDFTREELDPLEVGLAGAGGDPKRLLDEIHAWTNGHPYMTQKLCERLVRKRSAKDEKARVDALVKDVFFKGAPDSDANLRSAEGILDSRPNASRILALYKRLHQGDRVMASHETDVGDELRLTGMAMGHPEKGGVVLRVRNRIFAEVFDKDWIARKQARRRLSEPIAEWRKLGRDALPRGDVLREHVVWAKAQTDLTDEEQEFLREGLLEDGRVQAARAEEQAALALAERARAEEEAAHAKAEKARALEEAARAEEQAALASIAEARAEEQAAIAQAERARGYEYAARAEEQAALASIAKARAEEEAARSKAKEALAEEKGARMRARIVQAGIAVALMIVASTLGAGYWGISRQKAAIEVLTKDKEAAEEKSKAAEEKSKAAEEKSKAEEARMLTLKADNDSLQGEIDDERRKFDLNKEAFEHALDASSKILQESEQAKQRAQKGERDALLQVANQVQQSLLSRDVVIKQAIQEGKCLDPNGISGAPLKLDPVKKPSAPIVMPEPN